MAHFYVVDGNFVHASCCLFAIARNEWYGSTIIKKTQTGRHMFAKMSPQFFCDYIGVYVDHLFVKIIVNLCKRISMLIDYSAVLRNVITVISGVAPMRAGIPTVPAPILTYSIWVESSSAYSPPHVG